jgi:SAM-dependent methyltransferase
LTDNQHKKSYNKEFYAYEGATSIHAAKRMMPLILDFVHAKSIADVGCGTGKFLKESEQLGVSELLGIDGSWAAKTLAEGITFKEMDLSNPTSVDRTFDLAISLEVAEHLPKEAAAKFVAFLASLSPVVMFSAAIPFQGGQMHINEQWQSYWANLFAKQEYIPVDAIRPEIWGDASVLSCYRQNTLVYVRKEALHNYPKLQAIGVCKNVNLVHPDVYSGILQTYMGYAITLMKFIKKLPKPLRPIARYLPNKNIKKLAAEQRQPE